MATIVIGNLASWEKKKKKIKTVTWIWSPFEKYTKLMLKKNMESWKPMSLLMWLYLTGNWDSVKTWDSLDLYAGVIWMRFNKLTAI